MQGVHPNDLLKAADLDQHKSILESISCRETAEEQVGAGIVLVVPVGQALFVIAERDVHAALKIFPETFASRRYIKIFTLEGVISEKGLIWVCILLHFRCQRSETPLIPKRDKM